MLLVTSQPVISLASCAQAGIESLHFFVSVLLQTTEYAKLFVHSCGVTLELESTSAKCPVTASFAVMSIATNLASSVEFLSR